MNLLVTAGNTQAPIDKVRCLTNIFTGRTGAAIALEAYRRGHGVTLLTSHPEALNDLKKESELDEARCRTLSYRVFDDLDRLMAQEIRGGRLDAVIHCAAVSDYLPAGVYSAGQGTHFDAKSLSWQAESGQTPGLVDRAAGKVKSDEPELWLRLARAPKLVDKIRTDWGFRGVLVKFKLEVGVSDEQLLEIAEKSRRHSAADFMVANTLEDAAHWAYLGPLPSSYEKVSRRDLAERLLDAVESKSERNLEEPQRRKEPQSKDK
ncbi:MAG: bifunctional phosphopantothenoylcysteine decarboxylase/phosphopantothenate synthase [Gemmataceae bacterium]|nr:bifunctional phosphopantothenoylcysteine decarboxylase/phosphopantothenate synthase [Gemmataceae bacterium]MCI0739246.1 bifunctional phosphopantothenoylcysteine decarboxylase/phosphopantothenate synthase [Gemmataceae bacterium]